MKFNFDNVVFRALGKMVDCMVVSFLWFLFSLPIFTIGASTTALYYTVHKSIRRSRGYIYSGFWHAFKTNFKQSTIMWLIMMVIYGVLYFDAYVMNAFLMNGETIGYLFYLFLILFVLVLVWSFYVFAYTARFENTKLAIFKNCAVIGLVNFPSSLLVLVTVVVSAFLIYLIPILLFLVPACSFISLDLILERVFRKYMSPEDLAAEEESDKLDRD